MINQIEDFKKTLLFYGCDFTKNQNKNSGQKNIYDIKLEFYQRNSSGSIVQVSYFNNPSLILNTKRFVTIFNEINNNDGLVVKCVMKKDSYGTYRDFSKTELEFFYSIGFKLCDEHKNETNQQIEDWF